MLNKKNKVICCLIAVVVFIAIFTKEILAVSDIELKVNKPSEGTNYSWSNNVLTIKGDIESNISIEFDESNRDITICSELDAKIKNIGYLGTYEPTKTTFLSKNNSKLTGDFMWLGSAQDDTVIVDGMSLKLQRGISFGGSGGYKSQLTLQNKAVLEGPSDEPLLADNIELKGGSTIIGHPLQPISSLQIDELSCVKSSVPIDKYAISVERDFPFMDVIVEQIKEMGYKLVVFEDEYFPALVIKDGNDKPVHDITLWGHLHKGTPGRAIKEPTCIEKGIAEVICKICAIPLGYEIEVPELGHKWNDYFTIDREPTSTAPGEKSIHCSVCDERKDIQPIPFEPGTGGESGSGGEVEAPETGDSSNMNFIMIILGAASVILGATMWKKKAVSEK